MIENIYTEALLAAAAYAEWDTSDSEIKAELIKKGFTEAQYKTLFVGDVNKGPIYQVIPNGYTSDFNGFSATIFKNVDATSPDFNQLTVAFRGTDSAGDVIADINALLGAGDGLFGQSSNIN